jgi:glutaredoxin
MYLTPEQRVEYDADQAKYKEMHPDCEAHRWRMSGSRATHCGFCCPPVPISREQYEHIERIFANNPRREEELDTWERTLTCGHVVEQSVHHTNQHPSFSTAWCPHCEMTRGVVTSTKTVEAAARMAEVKRKREDKVARAERELKKAEKAAAEARKKLAEIQTER